MTINMVLTLQASIPGEGGWTAIAANEKNG